jgi:phosphate:Na+ symporter
MTLIITALAAGQISYENALALAIGANIGTTITAIIGSFTANFQGKRLALAHLVFNMITAGVALVFIGPIRASVDFVSATVGIPDNDFTLKLAVFHTIFNVLGVAIMLPLMNRLIGFLERTIVQPVEDLSKPKYLSQAVDAFPQTVEYAMRLEVKHLYDNAVELIVHGLNLHRHDIFATKDIAATVAASRRPVEFDIDERYETRVKTLYSAIVEFATRVGARDIPADVMDDIYALRDVSERLVRAVKSVKHLRRNASRYTERNQGTVTELYDQLRTEIARILVEIRKLDLADPEERSSLWLDQERIQVERDAQDTNNRIEGLIRKQELDASVATSFLNDSSYAYAAMRDLLAAARAYYIEHEEAMAEVERILALEDEELSAMVLGALEATGENRVQ